MKRLRRIVSCLVLALVVCHPLRAQCLLAFASYTFDCLTSTALASVTVVPPVGTPPYTYTWTPGGQNTSSVANLTAGSYTVTVKDANNCVTSAQLIIAYPFSPSNIAFTSTMVSCFGGNNGASAAAFNNSSGPPFTYTWSSSSGPFSNAALVTGLTAGVYTVSIKDNKGCGISNSVTISQPPLLTSSLVTKHITCFGGTLTSAISTTGGVSPYTYSLNGTGLSANQVTNAAAGVYTLVTTDSKTCSAVAIVTITQGAPNTVTFSVTKPSCLKKSDGAVTAVVTGPGPGPYSYTWQPVISNNAGLNNISQGSYTVTTEDGNGCLTTSVVVVNAIPPMVPNVSTKPENCSAGDGAFTVSVAGGNPPYTFTLIPGPGTGSVQTQLSSGNYLTVITDSKNCSDTVQVLVGNLSTVSMTLAAIAVPKCYAVCNGSFQVLTQNAVSPVTYSISGQPTTAVSSINNVCPGFYIVKVIDAIGCPASTTLNFPQPPVFSYSANVPPRLCQGGSATLVAAVEGGVAPFQFRWFPGNIFAHQLVVSPKTTTVYSLEVTDASGCSRGSHTVPVTVADPLGIAFNAGGAAICPGSTAQITPTVTGGDGNYRYEWLPGKATTPSVFVANIQVPEFTLTVLDGCNSPPASTVITLKLYPVTKPVYVATADTGCMPLCPDLTNVTPGARNIIWNFGDQPQEATGDEVSYCYRSAGSYHLKLALTDSNGCRTSFTYSNAFVVLPRPVTGFMMKPDLLTLNNSDNVLFKNVSNGEGVFRWILDGKLSGTGFDFVHTFSDTGCHHVKLVALGNNTCRDSTERSFCVFEGYNFYMPASFTPNGDGLNDVLLPKGSGWLFSDYSMEVFDRWGRLVFSSSEPSKGWDGGYRESENVPGTWLSDKNDVFVWRVRLTDNQSEKHEMKGHVMVVK